MIIPRFRTDYTGEFVVIKTTFRNGIKEQEREWVANPTPADETLNRAAVIGVGKSRSVFKWWKLQDHNGGLLGSNKLKTYGSGDTYKRMILDSYMTNEQSILIDIIESKYDEANLVYTTGSNCVRYPDHFYLLPYSPYLDDSVAAAYLAAFDGNKEIFLLGYDQDPANDITSETTQLINLVTAYSNVKWNIVSDWNLITPSLTALPNVKAMTYNEFITTCDI